MYFLNQTNHELEGKLINNSYTIAKIPDLALTLDYLCGVLFRPDPSRIEDIHFKAIKQEGARELVEYFLELSNETGTEASMLD